MNIKDFYTGLDKKKKIIWWICIGIIFLSILRVGIWSTRRGRTPTVKTFIKKLKSPNKNEKIYGIYNLGNLKVKEVLPEIEKIFQEDPNEDVKRVCAWSIAQIDFNKLLSYLDSSNKKIKEITFETIMKIDKNNVDYLVDRLDKEDKETKLKIISYINSPQHKDKLMKIVENGEEDIEVRKSALDKIKNMSKWEEVEASLWGLYYNEKNDEMKNYVYQTIKEMKEMQKKGGK
jgi:HEAT repeat protein